jgi:hypothetical protein
MECKVSLTDGIKSGFSATAELNAVNALYASLHGRSYVSMLPASLVYSVTYLGTADVGVTKHGEQGSPTRNQRTNDARFLFWSQLTTTMAMMLTAGASVR